MGSFVPPTLIFAVKSPTLGLKEILSSVLLTAMSSPGMELRLVSPTMLLPTALDSFLQGEFFRSSTSILYTRGTLMLMEKCIALKTTMMVLEPSELVLTLVLQEPPLVLRFCCPKGCS